MTGERVFEALTDCADELEGEIVARYVHADGVHPAMQHKYDRDMQTVIDARLAIDTLRQAAVVRWSRWQRVRNCAARGGEG
jgi:hypothetical protein